MKKGPEVKKYTATLGLGLFSFSIFIREVFFLFSHFYIVYFFIFLSIDVVNDRRAPR